MFRRLGRFYGRQLVNINVNIIVAGFLTLGLTLIPVYLTRHLGIPDARQIGNARTIAIIVVVSDIMFDVVIYYVLHWLANHWPGTPWYRPRDPAKPHLTFFRAATLVQFERALLAPVYYGAKVAVLYILLRQGVEREAALVVGFAVGLTATRVLHTLWLIYSGRSKSFH
jgi:hypothetical protein